MHCGIYPCAVILAVPQECRADPHFLPFSEPDSWVPVKKAFLPLSLFSLVSFLLMLVSLGAQCFPARGSGAPGKWGEAQEQPVKQLWLFLVKGERLLKGVFWETWSLQRWNCNSCWLLPRHLTQKKVHGVFGITDISQPSKKMFSSRKMAHWMFWGFSCSPSAEGPV